MAALTGCRQDMQDQPKFIPQRGSSFYPDGRSVRPQVANTVAREQAEEGSYFATGMVNGREGDGMPLTVTPDLLSRGQERFNIYCSPCHSRVGNGKGMIVQRGYHPAGNFHTARLREAPLGHFFAVITNGYGAMPNYAAELPPADRWAVVAYVRALQLSQKASATDVGQGAQMVPLEERVKESGFAKDFLGDWVSAAAPAAVREGTASGPKLKAGNAEQGNLVYQANCARCHQPGRTGLPPLVPSLLGVMERVGEPRVRQVARTGIPEAKPPMPPHPNITDAQLEDLIAFLHTK